MRKLLGSILIIVTLGWAAIFAQDASSNCAIQAWVEDKVLIKDIFVHENPETTSKNIGEIKFVMNDGDETIVEIIGYKNGWLKISKAETIEGQAVFEGQGWIPARRVTVNVQRPDGNERKSAPLYSLPSLSSKKVGTIPSEALVKIVGYNCFGLKVKYKGKTGWLPKNYMCGNPVTTCS
jgi:hypothetical protein